MNVFQIPTFSLRGTKTIIRTETMCLESSFICLENLYSYFNALLICPLFPNQHPWNSLSQDFCSRMLFTTYSSYLYACISPLPVHDILQSGPVGLCPASLCTTASGVWHSADRINICRMSSWILALMPRIRHWGHMAFNQMPATIQNKDIWMLLIPLSWWQQEKR